MIGLSSMTGCSTKFIRPAPDAIIVGKSTSADVKKIVGDPTSPVYAATVNNSKVTVMPYFYQDMWGNFPGVIISWRSSTYTLNNDVVVGEQFNSTIGGESTEFPTDKVSLIEKGKSTKADVLALLGTPSGKIIFPLTKSIDEIGLLYTYSYVRNAGIFTGKPTTYLAVVTINSQNEVTSVSLKKDDVELIKK